MSELKFELADEFCRESRHHTSVDRETEFLRIFDFLYGKGLLKKEPSNLEMVKEFHEKFQVDLPDCITTGSSNIRVLRVELIAEELTELANALCVELHILPTGLDTVPIEYQIITKPLMDASYVDITEAADGFADLEYVVHGGTLTFGIPSEKVFEEVHRSNMSKLDEKGNPIFRVDGKILKGKNYSPPDILKVLESDL